MVAARNNNVPTPVPQPVANDHFLSNDTLYQRLLDQQYSAWLNAQLEYGQMTGANSDMVILNDGVGAVGELAPRRRSDGEVNPNNILAAPETVAGALANILRAESLIGSAFGSSASDQVENPEDLVSAKEAYAAAAAVAKAGKETDALMGRVEEGLAAVSRYQGDKPGICTHATASYNHFTKAGVSDFLVEGPRGLADKFGCKLPK